MFDRVLNIPTPFAYFDLYLLPHFLSLQNKIVNRFLCILWLTAFFHIVCIKDGIWNFYKF